MKRVTLMFLAAAGGLLCGCQTTKIGGLDPAGPPVTVVETGWKSSWAPDGKRLVYGVQFGAGLEVLDLRTRETKPLVQKAKDAAWSPNGRWIAFVREASYNQYLTEEVWLMPAEGGEPYRVAAGGFPSWSADGRKLFVHSRRDNSILAVDPLKPNEPPAVFYANTPSWYFAVSPDQSRVAFGSAGRLEIRDQKTGKTVFYVPAPGQRGLLPAWSPDGQYVAYGGFDDSQMGLWVLQVATGQTRRLVDGNFTMPAWSPNKRWLSFDRRMPTRSVWVVGTAHVEAVFREGPAEPRP